MKVKLLKATWPHRKGDITTVDDVTGQRWVKNKIAVEVAGDGRQTEQGNPERPEAEAEQKTYNQLRAEAKAKGIKCGRMKKAELIETLRGGG